MTSSMLLGALGSTVLPPEPQKTDAAAHGFTEATQEGLYMALHNAKTSGKTGLGKGKGSGAHPWLDSLCVPGLCVIQHGFSMAVHASHCCAVLPMMPTSIAMLRRR